jgi:putative ABC transport system permease protein
MNLIKLSYSYLRRRALNTLLNVLLLSFGIATITILLLFSYQLEDNLYKNAEGIDVVVGAKGSPIQLILSSIYHIDNPTGNIELSEAKQLMSHPMVATATPLALGDNYLGYRIVGSTTEYVDKYSAVLREGTLWDHEFELVLGADVARNEGLQIGDTIVSSHGFSEAGHTHDNHDLVVVGILEPTGKIVDRLILTGVETMWGIHTEHDHEDDHDHSEEHRADAHTGDHGHGHEHSQSDGHSSDTHSNDANHDHGHEHSHSDGHTTADEGDHHSDLQNHAAHNGHSHLEDEELHSHSHDGHSVQEDDVMHSHGHDGHNHTHGRSITDESYLAAEFDHEQITSLLIRYRNPLAAAQFPRFVNDQTSMQAAAPAVEVTRLLNLLGVGLNSIRFFALVLILASVLGIFIALLNSMKERKYDLAIMRTLGGSRMKLFLHVIIEGAMISIAGGVLGIALGHIAMEGIGVMFAEAQQFAVTGSVFLTEEIWILLLAIGIGVVSSLIPALLAYRTDIAQTLSKT